MAGIKTYTDPDILAEHLGERLASELLRGRSSIKEAAEQFILDVQAIRACEAGEPIVIIG